MNIGQVLLKRNECERPVPYFAAALRLKPFYQSAQWGLAICRSRQTGRK